MLHHAELMSGSNFIELYDRMNLNVSPMHLNPDGAALYYGMYDRLSQHPTTPVVIFKYGAAGELGNISFVGPGGSLQTQAMAAFLVEVGGYGNAICPFPPHPLLFLLHTSAHAVFRQSIDRATGNSSLLMAMNIVGVGERARKRISSGL